jgi:3-phosphoshikimate 1-carboxyvinyltransferase
MGINITFDNNEMLIKGGEPKACVINSHNDHRIAMAGGIMNLFCKEEIKILNKKAVNKSYPLFFEELKKL